MPLKNQALTITYTAWDTNANAPKTGDAAQHALRLVRDGVEATPGNAPAEVDATNAPGEYRLALTAAEMNADSVTLCGVSSTSGVVIVPAKVMTFPGQSVALTASAAGAGNAAPVNAAFAVVVGTYWQQAVTVTGLDSTGWTEWVFAVKAAPLTDSDSQSLVLVKLTNPASGSDGLVTLKGMAAPDRTQASLSVGGVSPDTTVTWTLQAAALDLPPSPTTSYVWELVRYVGGRREQIGTGKLTVSRGVLRQTSAP